MKKSYLLIAIAGFTFSCSQPAKEVEAEPVEEIQEQVEATVEMAAEGDSTHFGALINDEGAVSTDEFLAMMEGKDSLEIKLAAVATEVCQKKGCWMKVETAEGETMRIRFKDYGFFVPKDLAGKEVVFSGKAYKETVSVEDLKHYAEDGGESEEAIAAITEPETSITFMADGVLIR